ncbi:MAG TPA: NADH-quinone oxidoreductase subunit C, partial [Methanomicrobiales archaeon]|nr:NADH-quinone oxidoreductase subunit C [Methanomicrobiales archaeon]
MTEREQTIIEIPVTYLLERTRNLQSDGYRLVQIGCTALAESYEINYSFDKDYQFQTLRIIVAPEEEVPSVSGIYWGA